MDIRKPLKHFSYFFILLFASCALAEQENSTPMPWLEVQKEIGALNNLNTRFFYSMCYFVRERCKFDGIEYVLIEGDTDEEIVGQVVHVKGNLGHDVHLIGHSELVVAGDVMPGANIYSDDISKVFVAGSFKGSIVSSSNMQLTVGENFAGTLATGTPATRVVIKGDLTGGIKPLEEAGLLSISVLGFTKHKKIMELYGLGYTEVQGYFGSSNHSPGLFEGKPGSLQYYTIQNQRLQ